MTRGLGKGEGGGSDKGYKGGWADNMQKKKAVLSTVTGGAHSPELLRNQKRKASRKTGRGREEEKHRRTDLEGN